MKLLIATSNPHKLKEIKDIFDDATGIDIVSLKEFPDLPPVVEDGRTLVENAVKKAKSGSQRTGLLSLGEDTGLEVECLNGAPGVFSARFAGEKCSYADNNRKLLGLLKGVPDEKRKATFRCVAAICSPQASYGMSASAGPSEFSSVLSSGFSDANYKIYIVEGTISGYISKEERGTNGFGYDPLFIIPASGRTFAEISQEEKNKTSHRATAMRKAKKLLLEISEK
ncbi:MAG: non-canonical purine NTP pyrophosphatase [Elusimicrobiota bacterium]